MYEGLPVIDATRNLQLDITKSDVSKSKKNDPANCAAAVCAKRELHKEVRVFLSRTYVKEKNHWTRYLNPEAISREIISFDRGSSFEPGRYVATAPTESQKIGYYRGKSSHVENKTKRQKPHVKTARVREFDRTKIK